MAPIFRTAYKGSSRGIVIAIDFGTTFSGISFAILEPGDIPQIQSVSRFEGQEDSSTKVPSIVYYDQQGKARALGEITNERLSYQALDEGWLRVEWLKLLFRPADHIITEATLPRITLPTNKTPVKVLSDILQYLKAAVKDYIIHNDFTGDALWRSLEGNFSYVLSHPNGWDGSQQSKLREASIIGGLVPNTDTGRMQIHFVSEGEASFHWCVENGAVPGTLSIGSDVIVADLGGGTIDVSSFRVTSERPLQVEETRPAQCRLVGSVFVTQGFRQYVKGELPDKYSHVIEHVIDEFDRNTKHHFWSPSHNHYIPIGIPSAHDPAHGIYSGELLVAGSTISQLFEPSCQAVTEAIRAQFFPQARATTVFLVGGFAASPWLFSEVQRRLSSLGLIVRRVERGHTAKAVAEGAVGYYLDQYVSARVARFTYGTFGAPPFHPTKLEHSCRKDAVYSEGGKKYVNGGFYTLVKKGTVVKENSVNRKRFEYSQYSLFPQDYRTKFNLISYRGSRAKIAWRDEDPDPAAFRQLCSVEVKIPASCFKAKLRLAGRPQWSVTYWRVVTFGTTEFTCYAEWEESGKMQRTPAKIVWNEG